MPKRVLDLPETSGEASTAQIDAVSRIEVKDEAQISDSSTELPEVAGTEELPEPPDTAEIEGELETPGRLVDLASEASQTADVFAPSDGGEIEVGPETPSWPVDQPQISDEAVERVEIEAKAKMFEQSTESEEALDTLDWLAKIPPEEVAWLLAELEELSDEEAQRLLDEELQQEDD
jgi:hypothetical protein